MSKRQIIKETVIRRDIRERLGAEYVYELIMRESSRVASYRIPLYSIVVEMTDVEGNKTSAKTEDSFADVGKALVFYDRIVEHLATPLNLPYILEDELF